MISMDKLVFFQTDLNSMPDFAHNKQVLLNPKGQEMTAAFLLYQYGLKNSCEFFLSLQKLFDSTDMSFHGNVKTNFKRIAQKISVDGTPFKVLDLVRGSV
jgi:hypothetical protein